MFEAIAAPHTPAAERRRRQPAARPPFASLAQAYDARLLAEVARWDDQAAFEDLYARHIGAVAHAALQICQDAAIAEDNAVQTFTALWVRAHRLVDRSVQLRPWLCTVARNAAIDHLRNANAVSLPIGEAQALPSAAANGPEESVLAAESASELHAALATLSPDLREAIELVYFAGLTHEAAATQTGRAAATIESRVRSALAHLHAQLAR